VLEIVLHRLRVRALPKDLPEVLLVDVTNLEMGKAIHLGEIVPPPGVQVLGDKHLSVIACAEPITEAQEAAALEAAPGTADVEMIKEKKEDGTEGAAPAKPGDKAAPAKAGDKAAAGKAAPAGDKAAEKKPADKKK
jgi:large subunit ribosomal protein L25